MTPPDPPDADPTKRDLNEDLEPSKPRKVLRTTPTHNDDTRRWLAYALVALLFILVIVGSVGWLTMGPNEVEHLQSFALIFSPVVTLVGTMLGFYYRSEQG